MKKCDCGISVTFFHVFLIFNGVVSTKSMPSGYSLEAKLNLTTNE